MAGCGMKKGGSAKMSSGKSGAGVAKQVPAQFAKPKDINGFKKGGKVSAKHDDAAQDKKLISKMIKSAEKKEPAGMKKGGKVGCYKTGGAVKNNTDKTWPAAKHGMKKVNKTPKDDTKAHFDNVKVTHSYASSGAAVKKLPMKLAAGGSAKNRKGFPNTLPIPKKK